MSSSSDDDIPLVNRTDKASDSSSQQQQAPSSIPSSSKAPSSLRLSKPIDDSDDDDSDSDDIPLSQIKVKIPEVLDDSGDDDHDDDHDDDDHDDDDDDAPLATVKEKQQQQTEPPAPPPSLSEESKKRNRDAAKLLSSTSSTSSPAKKKKKRTKEANDPKSENKEQVSESISNGTASMEAPASAPASTLAFTQQKCSEALYKTEKGKMVQELLCRWWYALEWPKKDEEFEQPKGSQGLEGFPGTFIVVKGEDMGTVLDKRTYAGKPTFINLFAKPAAALKELLFTAYRNQMKVLAQHEGEGCPLLKELEKAIKSVEKISLEKADLQAKKRLKKWKKHASELARLQQS